MSNLVTSTKFQLPTLKYAVDNKMLKPIALFYLWRAKYKIPIVYNFSNHKLAKQTGLHWKTIDRYAKKLVDHGFAEMRGDHLVLMNPHKGTYQRLETRPYISFESMYRRILTLLINNNLKEQQYNIALNYGIGFGKLSPGTRKKSIKNFRDKTPELESLIMPVVTCNSLGRLFGYSRITANKWIHNLIDHNYIKTKEQIKRVRKLDKLYTLPRGRFYIMNGWLYQHFGRSIEYGSYIAVRGLEA